MPASKIDSQVAIPAASSVAVAPDAPARTVPPALPQTHAPPRAQRDPEQDLLNRLRRIEGQIRGLIDMIQTERPCDDVATQMSAVRKAMDKAFYRMVSCSLVDAVRASKTDEQALLEVARAARLVEKFG